MWKQFMAYILALCLAFEAPATVYAAEQNGLTEMVNVVDETNHVDEIDNATEPSSDDQEDVTEDSSDDSLEEYIEDEGNTLEEADEDSEVETEIPKEDTIEENPTAADPSTAAPVSVRIVRTSSEEHRIHLWVELTNIFYMNCFYASEGEEELVKYFEGDGLVTIDNLKSGTEYTLRFCSFMNGTEYLQVKYSTIGEKIFVDSVKFEASISDDFLSLNLRTEIVGYTGRGLDSAYAHWEFIDALGRKRQFDQDGYFLMDGDDKYVCTSTLRNTAFLAGETYEIEMYLHIKSDCITIKGEPILVTAPASQYSEDEITFTCEKDEVKDHTINYQITVANDNPTLYKGLIFVRAEDSLEPDYIVNVTDSQYAGDGNYTGSFEAYHYISDLIQRSDYEVNLLIGGIRKDARVSFDNPSLNLYLEWDDSGRNEENAYDFVRAFKVVPGEGKELEGPYYLHLEYSTDGQSYTINSAFGVEIGPDTQYRLNYYSAEHLRKDGNYSQWLYPDTEYYLKWTLYDSETTGGNPLDIRYERLHTKESNVIIELKESTYNSQKFTVRLPEADAANLKKFNRETPIYVHIKKSDEDEKAYKGWEVFDFLPEYNYSDTILLTDLEEDTDYDVLLTDPKDAVYATFSFATPEKNPRGLSKPEAAVSSSSVILRALFSGNAKKRPSYVHFFYRKTDEADWTKAADSVMDVSDVVSKVCSTTLTDLERGVKYQYAIVLSEQPVCDDPDAVTQAGWKVSGSFETTSIVIPDDLTLSQETLYLNLAYANDTYVDSEGFGRKQLKVTGTPDNAAQDFVWQSSDSNVASVSQDGLVTAVGSGEATITVTSFYAKEGKEPASAECKVVVGNYQIGYIAGENGFPALVTSGTALSLYKDGTAKNYKLYRIDNEDESPVELSYSEFHVDSTNPQVVTWIDVDEETEEKGVIKAGNVGSARLVFTAADGKGDGVCTYLPVTVSAKVKGFDILGFAPDDGYTQYPAIKETVAENYDAEYTLAFTEGIAYTAVGEISPSGASAEFDAENFDWVITLEGEDASEGEDSEDDSASTIATVSSDGVVTPKAAGTVCLTVTAKEGLAYAGKTRKLLLHIKALPKPVSDEAGAGVTIYTLANVGSKIGDVQFPADFAEEDVNEGTKKVYWQWKYPDTPLVTNGVNIDSYPFEAVYQGGKYYPYETTVNVYIAKVTGMSVFDDKNKVVEVGGGNTEGATAEADTMKLTVRTLYQGELNTSAYQAYNYKLIGLGVNEYEGLNIKQSTGTDTSGIYEFEITATKTGTYTLKPVIQVSYTDSKGKEQTKKLASATYKIKAVENPQAESIKLSLASVPAGVTMSGEDGQDRVVIINVTGKDASAVKDITLNLKAEVTARNYRNNKTLSNEETKLTWKTSDSSVATVKASTNTHEAVVSVKGEGHTVLTAVAKDEAGCVGTLKIEIQNYEPRVSVSKVTVNSAFDYTISAGQELAAASSGAVEIVPAYRNDIDTVAIYDGDYAKDKPVSEKFRMVNLSGTNQWVVAPASDAVLSNGNYPCTLRVTTSTTSSEPYKYPLTVTVTEKKAKVTAKAANTVNLFYTSEDAYIDLTVSGTSGGVQSIQDIVWKDHSNSNGFVYIDNDENLSSSQKRLHFSQENIRLTNKNKLEDSNIAKGTLTFRMKGYKEPYEIKNVSIKWTYKKPSIVTQSTSTTLIPSAGKNSAGFNLYNKTDKWNMNYSPENTEDSSPSDFNKLVWGNANVTLSPEANGSSITYSYNGSKSNGSEKLKMTLMSDFWRESLEVTHTIKFATPTVYLSASTVTINTTRIGTASTEVLLKNAYDADLSCNDIVIEGKDVKSQELLQKDLLEIYQDKAHGCNVIHVKQNRTQTMTQSGAEDPDIEDGMKDGIKDGTYTYNVTPYYTDDQGNRKALKTLTLKVKATSKAVTAKTKTSGSLDLVQQSTISSNNIKLTPVFSNLGNNYTVEDVKLCGEYSKYFNLAKYDDSSSGYAYLTIKDYSKLKSGQKYKLSVWYTIRMTDGDTFTVTGAVFTVQPKQTAPKITVSNNNQVLYAAADISRTYTLSLPSTYTIESVSGSLDCNKDGTPDITVSGADGTYYNSSTGTHCIDLTVRITDRDGLVASVKGKTYSIPITVRLRGADGIANDVKTSIKVTVKR